MHKGLEAFAAIAVLLGAITFFTGRSASQLEAAGSDTAAFRAQLTNYMNDVESTLPLLEQVARRGGIGPSMRIQVTCIADQCAAARAMLAVEPAPGEVRMWNEVERMLSFNRAWWEIPSTLRHLLENQLPDGSEGSARLGDSPNDDCGISISPIAVQIAKSVIIIASQIADIVPDEIDVACFSVPFIKIIFVTVRALAEVVALGFETINDLRTDCLQDKIITLLDDHDAIDEALACIKRSQDAVKRLLIENDLTQTSDDRIGSLQIPQQELFEVAQIVFSTMGEYRRSEQTQRDLEAREFFERARYWFRQQDFKETYTMLRAAYRATVTK